MRYWQCIIIDLHGIGKKMLHFVWQHFFPAQLQPAAFLPRVHPTQIEGCYAWQFLNFIRQSHFISKSAFLEYKANIESFLHVFALSSKVFEAKAASDMVRWGERFRFYLYCLLQELSAMRSSGLSLPIRPHFRDISKE